MMNGSLTGPHPGAAVRLQVFISRSGFCSRRQALRIVEQGQVTVNGRLIQEPSHPVHSGDRVAVQGREIGPQSHGYVILNKPVGVMATRRDRFAKHTVLDLLPPELQHLKPVGRLDKNSEGLLLLTNDGELANYLLHPRYEVEKVYAVRIAGALSLEHKSRLEKGIMLEGQLTLPARIDRIRSRGAETELHITMREGRKRQIRLMFAAVGCPVTGLRRVRFGPLSLGRLPTGAFREVSESEMRQLRKLIKG